MKRSYLKISDFNHCTLVFGYISVKVGGSCSFFILFLPSQYLGTFWTPIWPFTTPRDPSQQLSDPFQHPIDPSLRIGDHSQYLGDLSQHILGTLFNPFGPSLGPFEHPGDLSQPLWILPNTLQTLYTLVSISEHYDEIGAF